MNKKDNAAEELPEAELEKVDGGFTLIELLRHKHNGLRSGETLDKPADLAG